jgi:hypothetical protein
MLPCPFSSVVDEANSNAWMLAVRNSRHWFEDILDDHPTRRLFGGSGDADEGLMIEQNINPMALASNKNAVAAHKAKIAREKDQMEKRSKEAAQAAILMAANSKSSVAKMVERSASMASAAELPSAGRLSRSASRERGYHDSTLFFFERVYSDFYYYYCYFLLV